MKVRILVGNENLVLEMGDLICLRCKHFDIKAYEKDIIEEGRSYSWNACKSTGTIWADGNPIACSRFEE